MLTDKRILKSSWILLLSAILIAFMSGNMSAMASPETTVSVVPDTLLMNIGDNFTVSITVSDAKDMSSWQAAIEYDGNVLNCNGVWIPDNNVFAGKNSFTIDAQYGPTTTERRFFVAGALLFAESVDVAGSQTLCQANFTVTGSGSTYLRIATEGAPVVGSTGGAFDPWATTLLDSKGVQIPFQEFSGTVSSGGAKIGPTAMFTGVPTRPPPTNARLVFLNTSGNEIFYVDEPVLFNASLSKDPDGQVTSYEWDFGDGNITTVETPVVYHTYNETNALVSITLKVYDNDGLVSRPYIEKAQIGIILIPLDYTPYIIGAVVLIILLMAVSTVRGIMRRKRL